MTAPAPTSHRLHRPERALALAGAVTVLALAVTGCGGGAEDPDTGTPVSTQSSSQGESPQPGGSESPAGPGSSTESSAPTPEPSGGEFVPASSEGPAQNVPVPEMPAVAKEQTQEGLEAALEYWWETEYYLRSTGQPKYMVHASASECQLCGTLTDQWPQLYEAGGWAIVEPVDVDVMDARAEEGGTTGFGTLRVQDAPVAVYSGVGEVFEEASKDSASDAFWSVTADFDSNDGQWKIVDLGVVKVNQ